MYAHRDILTGRLAAIELFRVFTRRISNRSVVGCIWLLNHILMYAHRDPRWPPSCNSNYLEYSLVVSRTAALLAALVPKVAQVKVFELRLVNKTVYYYF